MNARFIGAAGPEGEPIVLAEPTVHRLEVASNTGGEVIVAFTDGTGLPGDELLTVAHYRP
jgi:hypothetical protein